MLRLIAAELRHRRGRALALLAGIAVATASFTVLTGASESSRLEVRGDVAHHFRTAYDVLVRLDIPTLRHAVTTGRQAKECRELDDLGIAVVCLQLFVHLLVSAVVECERPGVVERGAGFRVRPKTQKRGKDPRFAVAFAANQVDGPARTRAARRVQLRDVSLLGALPALAALRLAWRFEPAARASSDVNW